MSDPNAWANEPAKPAASTSSSSDDLGPLFVGQVPWYRSRKFWAAVVSTAIVTTGALTAGPAGAGVALTVASPLLAWMGLLGAADVAAAARRK